MGCCSNRMGWQGNFDTYTSFEEKLGFDNVNCSKFTLQIIQLSEKSYQQKREEVGEFFRSYEFGKKILEGLDTEINKLLSYDKFDYNGSLDCSYVFLLGLMYSLGNGRSKAECIFKFFDRKNEGVLSTGHIKEVFKFFFEIAVIAVPATFENKTYQEKKTQNKEALVKLEEKAMSLLGKKSENITKLDFENKMSTDLKMVFQAASIRKEAQKTPPTPL